jgi:hypothetical protein
MRTAEPMYQPWGQHKAMTPNSISQGPAPSPPWQQPLLAALETDESLLWSGRPQPFMFARFELWFLIAAIPWTAVFFHACLSLDRYGPVVIPFFIIGVIGVIWPFRTLRTARATAYGITDKRVIISGPSTDAGMQQVLPQEIVRLECTVGADGCGRLVLRQDQYLRQTRRRTYWAQHEIALKGLANVQEAAVHLLALKAGRAHPNEPNVTRHACLPASMQSRLDRQLQAGEHVIWAGQPDLNKPDQDKPVRRNLGDWLSWLLGAVFSVGFQLGMLMSFLVFVVLSFHDPFFLVGVILFAPMVGSIFCYWVDTKKRQRLRRAAIIYAVTTHRAIVMLGTQTVKTQSFFAGDIVTTELLSHGDGLADVLIYTEQDRDSEGTWGGLRHGFFDVPNGQALARLVKALEQ